MFVRRLGDDEPQVRENACWTLGHLKTVEAKAPLELAATDDEDEAVRTRANWTLAEIR
jgi:HEAT repeat protein